MLARQLVLALVPVLALFACGGGDGPKSIRGTLDRQSSSVAGRSAVEAATVDEIWALPLSGLSLSRNIFDNKIVVPVAEDGSFQFQVPDNSSYDYILALVDSTKCTADKARADWVEADLDRRLQCIQGYVAIAESAGSTNASGSDAVAAMPVSQQSGTVDVGNLVSIGNYAVSEDAALEDVSGSFSSSVDELKAIAKVDNLLSAISYLYANLGDDPSEYYALNLDYTWVAPSAIDSVRNQFSDPAELEITPFTTYFESTVDSSAVLAGVQAQAGYLTFVPAADVTFAGDGMVHGPSNPISTEAPGTLDGMTWYDAVVRLELVSGGSRIFGNLSSFTGGLPTGPWKQTRDGVVVAKVDLSTSAPFELESGQVDETAPVVFLPTMKVNTEGDVVVDVELMFTVWDGSAFVPVPFGVVRDSLGDVNLGLAGDESAACPADNHVRTAGSSGILVEADRFRWVPPAGWKMGAGDAMRCGITNVTSGYNVGVNSFQFHWSVDAEIH